MDVHGGKGICLGPSNYLGRAYQQTPIAITVEGANILTRSMIIFGQGAIRGHPYVLREIAGGGRARRAQGARARSTRRSSATPRSSSRTRRARSGWGSRARASCGAPGDRHTRRYYRQLTRLSSAFAFTADVAMFVLGGALKRRERLSARLGDILSPALSRVVRAEALRGRRAPARRPAAPALVGAGRARAHRGGFLRPLPEPAGRVRARRCCASSCFRGDASSRRRATAWATRSATSCSHPGPRATASPPACTSARARRTRSPCSKRRSSRRKQAEPIEQKIRAARKAGTLAADSLKHDVEIAAALGHHQQGGSAARRAARARCGARRSWSTIFRRTCAGREIYQTTQPVLSR